MAMSPALLQMWLMILAAVLLVLVWFLRSFIFAWLDVRRAQGSKFLIRVRNPTSDYFRAGTADARHLYFIAKKRRDNKDPNRMIPLRSNSPDEPRFEDAIYRSFGVSCIDVDDEKNCIIHYRNAQYHSVASTNVESFDEAVKTAGMKPSLEDQGLLTNNMMQWVTIIGFIIIILGGVYLYSIIKGTHSGLIETFNLVTQNNLMLQNLTKTLIK